MNNFLELHTDSDYRNINRPYYTGTWEMITIASDYMIPFQWESSEEGLEVYKVDKDGVETSLTGSFWDSTNKITSWSLTGTGTWTVGATPIFSATATVALDYIDSNEFTLSANELIYLDFNAGGLGSPANWTLGVFKDGVLQKSQVGLDVTDDMYYTATVTGSDYTVRLIVGTIDTADPSVVATQQSTIKKSGDYWWYNGFQLSTPFITEVCYLKVVNGSDIFYSDWMDPCGFTDKLKYKISSEYDFGGIKYDDGYEQWIYKRASVRRSPRGEIEQTGVQRNGVLILEKSVSAVRYVIRMKCTEPEYEAFIHSIGGTIEITDMFGKVYTPTNIEISDPTWFRSNSILEISFTDQNNISVWNKNNSSL